MCTIVAACGTQQAAERVVTAVPPVAPVVEPPAPIVTPAVVAMPPPVEPVVTLPPCPDLPARDKTQKPDHVVQLVELSDAMTVVDLGSGDGYFLCRLSRAVGARGRVIATEVSKPLVRALEKRVAHEQLANVEVVHAPMTDVGIAAASADRILLVKVWHHMRDRKRYAARIARALTPGGKVVVVDYKAERWRNGHGIAPELVIAELAAGGIEAALVTEELPDQYVIIGSARAPAN
jgi:predicted methyltransferase